MKEQAVVVLEFEISVEMRKFIVAMIREIPSK
jgi:hypothetical protein